MAMDLIIETKNLRKNFISKAKGKSKIVEAVKGINLSIRKGEIFGLLGPNGAGKSTTQKMFSTILMPTSGEARINGFDLSSQQQQIRQSIGYVSQAGGTDTMSTGMENLILQAQLYGIDSITARRRSQEFIERFQMSSFVDRLANGYSGGQRRRLDLALGMINHPKILLLDEPTVGLDPQSRAYLWEEIKNLQKDGITVVLTTHYLDEADKLCDTIAIIDNGEVAAIGTPDKLKSDIGGDTVRFGFSAIQTAQRVKELFEKEFKEHKVLLENKSVHLHMDDSERRLPGIIRLLDASNLAVQSINMTKPSLDDVFLKHTGRSLREDNI